MRFIKHCVTWLRCPSDLPPFHLPHHSSSCQLPTHPLCSRQTEFPQLGAMISHSPDPMLSGTLPCPLHPSVFGLQITSLGCLGKITTKGASTALSFSLSTKENLKIASHGISALSPSFNPKRKAKVCQCVQQNPWVTGRRK